MKKLLLALIVLLTLLLAVGVSAAEAPAPDIYAANLSFEDAVYIMYAVDTEGLPEGQVKMLFWTAPILEGDADAYVKGTEDDAFSAYGTTVIKGKTYQTFKYNKLRAKNMTDVIYARAYVEVDGVAYYSELSKYSILQYAYNKLGYTGTATTAQGLKNLLNAMLTYGTMAQEYFAYHTDRLATDSFYKVSLEGGVLADGTTHGLYLAGEEVTITAPEVNAEGVNFTAWLDSEGSEIATTPIATVTVGTANATYLAFYVPLPSEGLEFTPNDDGESYSVTGIGSCTDTDIIIPATYEGKPVTSIGDWAFYNCRSLTSVTIPDSVTSIGWDAFLYCSSLTSVTIPDSVTTIGGSAFDRCTGLTSVTIPDSVTSIGGAAFGACSGLASIAVASGNPIYHSNGNCLIETASKTLIAGCKNSVIPTDGSVTYIGGSAFSGCSSLTSIIIPDSVTSIGDHAFWNCSGLTSVTIPDRVTSIGDSAFSGCKALTSVTIGNSVTSIGLYSFDGCSSLTSVTIPDSVTTIGAWSFSNCGITVIDIPDSVTSIGKGAFSYCTGLTSVTIPDSVTSIGWAAFEGCSSLASVTIPDSVTSIGGYAFSGCTGLTSVTIPDSVTTIGGVAFYDCSSLTSITIPDSVTSIGDYAFYGCSSLAAVYYGGTAADWSGISISTYENGNSYLTSATRYYYSETKPTEAGNYWHWVDGVPTAWPAYVAPTYSEGLTFILNPDEESYSVTGIGSCTDTDIIIPATYEGKPVTAIFQRAFLNRSQITSMIIPYSVTSIGSSAFYACTNLTAINIPDGVTSIGDAAFGACHNLTSVTIPNGVTSIGEAMFTACINLTSVTIPDSVTSIGDDAFRDCANLTTVYYGGTAADWSGISISTTYNSNLTSATRYYYSETAPTEAGNYWHWVDDVPTKW